MTAIREDLLALLARTASDFISQPTSELDSNIDRTLASIGRLFDVDRAYVFRLSPDAGTMSNTHEWCGAGVDPQRENLQGLPADVAPWWMEELRAGRAINLTTLDDLPPHATAERAILEPQGIRSLLVLPLVWRGQLDGFAGFDHVRGHRTWTQEEIEVLRVVVSSFAQGFERRRIDERLELAATVFHNAHEGIFVTDSEERILDINPTFTEITGYSREDVIGRTPNLLSSGRHGPDFYAAMWGAIGSTGHWRGEVWNRRRDGTLYLERLTVSSVRDATGRVERYVGVFSDITRLREQAERLEQLAYQDALTKLPNRALLGDRMEQALAHARRSGSMLAVGYLDLDGFKPVNDRHGHAAGDRLLVEMAQRLKGTLRSGDTVARLGGDEFVVLMPGLHSREESEVLVDRILRAIAEPFEAAAGHVASLTASIGVRIVPPDDADPDTLLRQADQAMYAAKQEGRGRAHFFDPEHDRQVVLRRDQIARVGRGIAEREMVLHFQPVVDLRTGMVRFAEALVRWRRADLGMLSPAEWLPAVEDTPVIADLGDWVLDEALRRCASWGAMGLCGGVSVNVSAYELRDPAFPERVRRALERHPHVPASKLKLEVLESAALADIASVTSAMDACRLLGVEFALDDFGTGYSSLTYLKRLPASTLKIDRSFVSDMLTDDADRAIVTGVVELARVFGRASVAEGVESTAHAEALRALGCDMGQGYGFAPPMPAEALEEWMRPRCTGGTYTSAPHADGH
jgi:diguanylate cyclase (GGDEF)-like protein/PAS domain S-box-containing protein